MVMIPVKANGIITISAAPNGEAPSTKAITMVAYREADAMVVSRRLESVDSSSSRMARPRSARSTRYEP